MTAAVKFPSVIVLPRVLPLPGPRFPGEPRGLAEPPGTPSPPRIASSMAPVGRRVAPTRRLLVAAWTAVGVLLVAVLVLGSHDPPRLAQPAGAVASEPVITVRDGDTLWSIASRVAPQRDPRAEVYDLITRNRLRGPDLVPGQRLRVR